MNPHKRAVVAGHICLDIIPGLDHLSQNGFLELLKPGCLVDVGEAVLSTGGPVSNTGLALHILGIPTQLIAKTGVDAFGSAINQIVSGYDPRLAQGIRADPSVRTSYTIILNPAGMDRFFMHYPGANDAFFAHDIDYGLVEKNHLFHFGYPPVMRTMYVDEGRELVKVFRSAKETGVTTSLDMALPSPTSEAARMDWRKILAEVLPYVDVFAPSVEELIFLLHGHLHEELCKTSQAGGLLTQVDGELLKKLSQEILDLGAKIVLLKLGFRGAYLKTGGMYELQNVGKAAPQDPAAWANLELWTPCFNVQVAGTTGSGDATIAGFLSAFLRGFSPHQALTAAAAVGACNVEAPDALSGLLTWEETLARIESGWARQQFDVFEAGWELDKQSGVWFNPNNWLSN